MTKGKAPKVINAATHKPLNQARLIGLNDHVKSIRQKPYTPHDGLKQAGLASFGFGNVSKKMVAGDLLETPLWKRRKHLSPSMEVPETQFAQNTQSLEPNYHDAFADVGMEYSSPLSSPPTEGGGGGGESQNTQSPELNYHDAFADVGMEYSSPLSSPPTEEEGGGGGGGGGESQNTQSPELNYHDAFADVGMEYSSPLSSPPTEEEGGGGGGSQVSVSSIIAMPPPLVPVTPKRRRVVEVPDSKSPPTTPFTPYQSQQERGRLNSQASPTARLNKPLMAPQVEDMGEDVDKYHNRTIKRTGRTLFAPGPKRLREKKDDKAKSQETKETQEWKMPVEVGEIEEGIATGNRGRTIDSSQWWDLEDTQDAPLSTQNTPTQKIPKAQNITTAPVLSESQDKSFRVNLSYKSDPPFRDLSNDDSSESQGANHMGDHKDTQKSFHSMSYPMSPEFCDDTPEPEPEPESGEHPALPIDENKARPILEAEEDTASEEEYPEPEDGSEVTPKYDAYRTQQFPSSFWQHEGTYRHEPPGLLVGSQWGLGAVCGEDPAERDEMQPSQWIAPGIVNEPSSAGKEGGREWEPSQWIAPRTAHSDTEDTEAPSQFLPGAVMPAMALLATVDEGHDIEDALSPLLPPGPDPTVAGERDDGDQTKKEFKHHNDEDDNNTWAITTSQLLPSELMETFPMPPPLSQYSSYDYGYDDLSIESETQ